MKTLFFSFLALTFFALSAHAKLTMDQTCARQTNPPPYTEQDLEKLQHWLDASVALAYANTQLNIDYDKEAFMKTCPNLALFNFGRATNCIPGLATNFAREDRSWQNMGKIKTPAAMKTEFKKAMERFSKKFEIDLNTIVPSVFPPAVKEKIVPSKSNTYFPDSPSSEEVDASSEDSSGTSAQ